ncbi:galactose oxidase early set domain-containing protein [Streptomyces sp. NPDC048269]|uniref:galactose oxidase early set domain-containing protein n=1 Tax=Streptomyces sp. NPDC048269 TaxID=3155753 RepID=UPI00341DCB97
MPNIRIDASSLSSKKFLIPGQTATPVDGTAATSFALAPGTYAFQQTGGPLGTFNFDVTADGLVTYDPANDGFLSGRGTDTLIVRGFTITLDGRALSHDLSPFLMGNSDVLSRTSTHDLTLTPGTYAIALAGVFADFAFMVGMDGQVSVEPRFAGFAEASGRTLTIHGYRITIDGRALSHDLTPFLLGNGDVLSRTSTHELTLMPAEFAIALAGVIADFRFVLSTDGQVSVEPPFAGFAEASGQTLTIHGYRITIDGRALSHDLTPFLLGNGDVLSRTSTHELTLMPAEFAIALAGVIADFRFVLSTDGQVSVEPPFAGFAEASGQTLTIHGYRITIDGRALSHDLTPFLLGNGDVLSRTSTHELTLVPAQIHKFLPTDGAGTSFTLTLDVDGKISVTPSGLTAQRTLLHNRLLDDFTTGGDNFSVPLSATTTRSQAGTMLGGERSTSVTNLTSPQGAPARLEVGGADRLRLTLGADQQARLQVSYGLRADGTPAPLGVNLHDGGADRLRTTISQSGAGGVDVKVTIVTAAGPSSASARASAGLSEFRFVDFTGPGGQDFTNVSHIIFEFTSGGSLTVDDIEARGPFRLSHLMSWNPRTDESGKLAVHAALLHTGQIVFFSGDEHDPGRHFLGRTDRKHIDSTRIYDCRSGAVRILASPEVPPGALAPDLFCCGHAFLPDGRLLVAGGTESWDKGHEGDPDAGGHHTHKHFTGLRYTWIFDPEAPLGANPWKRAADMRDGRWYPTLVTLGDGDCLALCGHPSTATVGSHVNLDVETFSGSWNVLGAVPVNSAAEISYPRVHVLKNGEVFCATPIAGECKTWGRMSGWNGSSAPSPPEALYSSIKTTSVLLPLHPPNYEPQILICGGKKSFIVRPHADKADRVWTETSAREPIEGSRSRERKDSNAVILPTGEIMVCGGFDGDRAMVETELYDPAFEEKLGAPRGRRGPWMTLPDTGTAKVPRGYHSVALLMPDGRVFTAGSNKRGDWSYHNRDDFPGKLPEDEGVGVDNRETRIEIYEPPYVESSDRPKISSAPSTIGYAKTFLIDTPDVDRIRRVALIRAGSVTHAFNSDQRYVRLLFTRVGDRIEATSPLHGGIAPPGWYLLFIVAEADGQAVPSEGVFVRLSVGCSGNPVLIQGKFGGQGNFELVTPRAEGGLAHFIRNNDNPASPWVGPFRFGAEVGRVDAVTMIQSNFGDPGNLEVLARHKDDRKDGLVHFFRDSEPPFTWHGPFPIVPAGVSGIPVLIQSKFGDKGNFELITPMAAGGLGHFVRDNDNPTMPWAGPFPVGTGLGTVDAVTMIQSNFGDPGNLEVIARIGPRLAHLFRDPQPPFTWRGPFFPFPFVPGGVSGNPVLIQSKFGDKGNFELITPMAAGGLGHFVRDNDNPTMPWAGPFPVGTGLGTVDAVTMIQSNFGDPGNLEVIARIGPRLAHLFRDPQPPFTWRGPFPII